MILLIYSDYRYAYIHKILIGLLNRILKDKVISMNIT